MPFAGSASTSSPLARSTASIVPMRERWTGWTAVTTPMDGRPIAARSAISPPTYMPISRTAAACSGPRRRTVSGRPISLFWLPSLLRVRNAVAEDRGDRLLGGGLGDAAGDPDHERGEAGPPAGRHGAERDEPVGDPDDGHVAECAGIGRMAGSRAGPRPRDARASARWSWPSVRSPGRATKTLPGSTRRESTAAPRIGRSDRARRRPPVRRTRSSAVKASVDRPRHRRIHVGHRRPVSHAHRSPVRASEASVPLVPGAARARCRPSRGRGGAGGVPVGEQVRGRDGVGGDAAEELERHDRHLQLADAGDGRRALLDADGDRRGRARPSRARCTRRTSS